MIKTNLFDNTESRVVAAQKGVFSVIEYLRDISVSPDMAQVAYFASEMNVRKRQLVAELDGKTGVIAQGGAMQLLIGQIEASAGIRGAGDLFKKLAASTVTEEPAIKPLYTGEGTLVLEPTFNHIILLDMDTWTGDAVIEDGMFLACEDTVETVVTGRKTVSSLILGKEGLFNTTLTGSGIAALESPVPADELITVELDDDTLRIDGNMAVAWSSGLKFTVEKTTKTLAGSFASGEGLVNVYEGTGRVLIAPVRRNFGITAPKDGRGTP